MIKRGDKEGLSPVVSTVLLILIVMVLALIIMLWARGFIKEQVYKFEDTAIDQTCGEVSFEVSYSNEKINIINKGNVNINEISVKKISPGHSEVENVNVTLGLGGSKSVDFVAGVGVEELVIIPVLLGKTEDGKIHSYTCPEKNGVSVVI